MAMPLLPSVVECEEHHSVTMNGESTEGHVRFDVTS